MKKKKRNLYDDLMISLSDRIEFMCTQLDTPDVESPLRESVIQLNHKVNIIVFLMKINRLTPYKHSNLEGWRQKLNELTKHLKKKDELN